MVPLAQVGRHHGVPVTSLRLGWRAGHPPPPPVAMPGWQRTAAAMAHKLMYALLFLIPLSGWLYSSATGVQVSYLGLVTLPDLVAKDKALASLLKGVHVGANCCWRRGLCPCGCCAVAPLGRSRRNAGADAAVHQAKGLDHAPKALLLLSLGMLLVATEPAVAQGVLVDKSEIRFTTKSNT